MIYKSWLSEIELFANKWDSKASLFAASIYSWRITTYDFIEILSVISMEMDGFGSGGGAFWSVAPPHAEASVGQLLRKSEFVELQRSKGDAECQLHSNEGGRLISVKDLCWLLSLNERTVITATQKKRKCQQKHKRNLIFVTNKPQLTFHHHLWSFSHLPGQQCLLSSSSSSMQIKKKRLWQSQCFQIGASRRHWEDICDKRGL